MRGSFISFCELLVCIAALLMLAWFGTVCLIGVVLAFPGKLIARTGKHLLEGFDDDLNAAWEWLEAQR